MPLLIQGDARRLPLADESVDLIVTSPPYWSLRSYSDGGEHYAGQIGAEPMWQEYLDSLIDCTREWARVLKPSGSAWVNLGDKFAGGCLGGEGSSDGLLGRHSRPARRVSEIPAKSLHLLPHRYAIRCCDELGLIVRQDQVWSKVNSLPESVTDRTRRSHEYLFHLVKQPHYYSAVDEIREPTQGRVDQMSWDQRKARGDAMRQGEQRGTYGGGGMAQNPLGKLPGSVWEVATQPLNVPDHVAHARCCDGRKRLGCEDGLDHYAAFPFALVRSIILGWSPRGGVVADPFGGTGSTALVAAMHGRTGISVDASWDYGDLIARWRIHDPKERARAAGFDPDVVARIPATDPLQGSLMDLLSGAS
jgi:site-specific DNA-methyltransferase (cytosine-N4-specific)